MPKLNLNPLKQLLVRLKTAPPEPELPPIKPPDFVQFEDSSPVGTWVGLGVAGAAMVMGLSFLGNRSSPAPKLTPQAAVFETIPSATETIPAETETKAPVFGTNHRSPATPKTSCADGTTVHSYTRKNGTHVDGHSRGCPDGDKSNNKRPRKRTG